jgi:hypothetical protein
MQRIFHGKNRPNRQIFKGKFSKLPDLDDKFQQVAKNTKGFLFFLKTFISSKEM